MPYFESCLQVLETLVEGIKEMTEKYGPDPMKWPDPSDEE